MESDYCYSEALTLVNICLRRVRWPDAVVDEKAKVAVDWLHIKEEWQHLWCLRDALKSTILGKSLEVLDGVKRTFVDCDHSNNGNFVAAERKMGLVEEHGFLISITIPCQHFQCSSNALTVLSIVVQFQFFLSTFRPKFNRKNPYWSPGLVALSYLASNLHFRVCFDTGRYGGSVFFTSYRSLSDS